ncbi:antigen 5 like allergen Cul n 1-like [Phlebotomus papatasi]|uniref:antigen 5 like allergen Cul n 1-like n=1 Tax=Phlebotomus papatasi TaxID=29031 RepID=UPI002483E327|nr:antigen 5 like allergen Cul n 1-like [Phlebotomus papatasi]
MNCSVIFWISFLYLVGGLFGEVADEEVDWCDIEKKFCPQGTSHIACSGNAFGYGECEDLEVVEMSSRMKKMILLRHNYYRNLVAGGLLDGKPSASKMAQIHWDEKLEYLARKHVEHCNFAHDGCRATDSWRIVGQNIALFESKMDTGEPEEHLVAAVDLWFAEHFDATVNAPFDQDVPTGHFLTMMLEGNHRMGCSMARYRTLRDEAIRYNYLITCDYSDALVIGEDTYQEGPPCSLCHTLGAHPSYIFDSLCDDQDNTIEEDSEDYSATECWKGSMKMVERFKRTRSFVSITFFDVSWEKRCYL